MVTNNNDNIHRQQLYAFIGIEVASIFLVFPAKPFETRKGIQNDKVKKCKR
jgi:hypothetical protein